ncbi:MAG TPA: hypothetical protein VOA41_07535 [Candidatus Dormibacteraeota bacterium]|nr:hypothetical protein [Candidatus Dormibacteraeota bacterium]
MAPRALPAKARNLKHNPKVSVHLESGDDVVILEGIAVEISDQEAVEKLDAPCKKKYKMPLTIMPGESVCYGVRPRMVLAWLEKSFPTTAALGISQPVEITVGLRRPDRRAATLC